MNSLNANVENLDGTGPQGSRRAQGANEFMYVFVPANALRGQVYLISYTTPSLTNTPKLITPATLLAVEQYHAVVLQDQGATAGWAWVQTRGLAKGLVTGAVTANSTLLKVLTATNVFTADGTTRTINTVSGALTTQASGTNLIDVYLTGEPAVIS